MDTSHTGERTNGVVMGDEGGVYATAHVKAPSTTGITGPTTLGEFGADRNYDGVVDSIDLVIVQSDVGKTGNRLLSDFNGNRIVDAQDVQYVQDHMNP